LEFNGEKAKAFDSREKIWRLHAASFLSTLMRFSSYNILKGIGIYLKDMLR
jgi:hypothetical protein